MADRMLDLEIRELVDGGFELVQNGGSLDDDAVVRVHKAQVLWLAELAGVVKPADPTLLDRLTDRHAGLVRALAARFEELDDAHRADIVNHCHDGVEIALHLRAIWDLIDALLCDMDDAQATQNDKSDASISVTQSHDPTTLPLVAGESSTSAPRRRGRPPTGHALSNAERQAKHRQKQAEQQELLPAGAQP